MSLNQNIMQYISPIKSKILQYIEYKGVSKYQFYKESGITRGVLDKESGISEENIAKFIAYADDINVEWLIIDKGEMIKTKPTNKSDPLIGSQKGSHFSTKTKYAKNVTVKEPDTPYNIKPFLLNTDKQQDQQLIPIYNIEASAGLVKLLDNAINQVVIDYISIPNLPSSDGALYVTGDSMYPLLKSGDIVVYKQIQDIKNDIFYGEMYILSVDISGEELILIKYVQKSDKEGYIKLVSYNKHHSDKDVPISKIRALALIKASIRYNMMY